MNTFLKKLETRETLERCLDTFSLFSVLQYCVYRFLQSTMFNLYYSQRYKLITMGLLLVFGGIRYLYIFISRLKGYEEKQDKIKYILRCGGAWLLALPFFYVGWLHDNKNLIFLPICCMCLYDMDAGKICRAFAVTIGTCLLATILCCLSGTVRNLVDSEKGFVGSYGIINTTDFASYFSFLLLLAWCGIRRNEWYTSLLFSVFTLVITYGVYRVSGSRTSFYTGGLTALFTLWDCLERRVPSDQKWFQLFRKSVKWISILAFPIIAALVIFLTIQFASRDPWAVQLNETLSGRLSTVLVPYRTYGIKLFGNTIENMHGQGGTILGQFWSSGYGYLDVAYAMLAIKYGWVITVIFTAVWIWMNVRAFKTGRNRIGYALVIMAAHAFSEARILDVNYNLLLIMPFCLFAAEKAETVVVDRKRDLRSVLIGCVIVGVVYILLPNILSWLRTYFYLKGWNSGTAAFKSFIMCTCIVLSLLAVWKAGSSVFKKYKLKGSISQIFFLLGVTAVSIIIINSTIEQGRSEQADRLSKEEEIIRSIQEVSTQPVYASEAEELYSRDGIKIEKHLFSTEELGKSQGTIIVDASVNAPSVILSGGQYAQISDQTGLYTYDPSVIEVLKQNGIEVTRSYTGIQRCDLRDLALFNGIDMKDRLQINSQKVITANAENDQLFGQYQAKFSFSELTSNTEGDVALLEVLGERGERTLVQETLTNEDFDVDGNCEYVLTYQIQSTPGASYAITAKEGVSVVVDGISWRRLPSKENEDLLHRTIQIGQHESSGVKYTGNPDGTLTVTGEATDISFYNIYLNKHGFPGWLQKRKEYVVQIDDPEEMVSFEIYLFDGDQNVIFPALVSTKTSQIFSLPDDAYGIIIRFRAWGGKPVDTIVTPVIYEN